MKARFIFIAALFPLLSTGQVNLIPNPSFEDTLHCSSDTSVVKTKRWYRPSACGTPDFYYPLQLNWSCSAHFPQTWGGGDYLNNRGYQAPRTGIAYAGFGVSMGAELMAVGLTDSMLPGKTYAISFYTSLAELSVSGLDQINLCFMQDSVTDFNGATCWSYLGSLHVDAGNQAGNIITDTISWVLVQDTFIAEGGERYMIIGNIDTAVTQYSTAQIGSYYYFDDFDVHCIDCTSDTSEPPIFKEFSVTPNPSAGEFSVSGNFLPQTRLIIYNTLGQKITEVTNFPEGNNLVSVHLQLAQGLYYYELSTTEKLAEGKLMIVE